MDEQLIRPQPSGWDFANSQVPVAPPLVCHTHLNGLLRTLSTGFRPRSVKIRRQYDK